MKRAAVALLLFALTSIVRAGEPVKPNTLTSQEIADGWILLFDGKTTFGWTSPNDSKWTIIDGMLAPQKDKQGALVTTTAFCDPLIVLDLQLSKTGKLRLNPSGSARSEGEDILDLAERQ